MIIAITGGSGAGKSTLARALATRLQAPVIAEDDYYHCATAIPGFDAETHNFDAPSAKDHALLAEHLRRFRAGSPFDKPLYDLVTHTRRSETERIAPADALIVDGLHVLATADLRALFDLRVFVHAGEALRLGRRLVRDIEARGREPRSVLGQFFANVLPMHHLHVEPQRAFADLVVEFGYEGGDVEAAAERIAATARPRR